MKPGGQIPSLNGLRAISIALVLIGHAAATMPYDSPVVRLVLRFLGNANAGVLTFFVISGYLITTLLRNEMERSGRIDLRGFYLRRVLRIFPAFYAYIAVVAVLIATGILTTPVRDVISAGTFSLNYKHLWVPDTGNPQYWFVGHFWTLALEEQFYLLWPLTLLGAGLFGAKRVAIAIILVSPFIRVATYFLWPEARGQIGLMLHTGADPMMFGSLVALCERNQRFERWIAPFGKAWLAAAAALFLLVVSPMLGGRFGGSYSLAVGMTLDTCAVVVVLLYVIRHPGGAAGRVLNSRPMVYVGLISYSLYLWQQLFLTTLNTTWSGQWPLNLLACFAVAMLSYHCLEMPFLRLKSRIRKPAPVVVGGG